MYLELLVTSTNHRGYFAHAMLPLDAARRLRDQLSAHLDAADRDAAGQSGPWCLPCVVGAVPDLREVGLLGGPL